MLAMPDSSPLFQVARIPYATPGTVETIHLDTTGLLKTASIYARDLLFTLNLSSSQEDRETTLSSSSSSSRGLALERRIVSTIQPRRKETILLSFGKIQAVASLDHILLFNAHLPDVRDLARELTASFQTTPECRGESAAVPIGGSSAREPNELIFLEFCLRDTVDSYFRRLRLFEPIGACVLALWFFAVLAMDCPLLLSS